MVRLRSFVVTLLVFVSLLLAGREASATSALRLDVASHVAASSAVVEVRVVRSSFTTGPRGQPLTATRLTVLERLAGDAPAELVLLQIGGAAGERRTGLVGDATLSQGERLVLFLHREPDGTFWLTALAQSAYHVLGDGEGALVARRLDGLSLFDRDASGKLRPAKQEDELHSLAELRAAVLAVRDAGVAR